MESSPIKACGPSPETETTPTPSFSYTVKNGRATPAADVDVVTAKGRRLLDNQHYWLSRHACPNCHDPLTGDACVGCDFDWSEELATSSPPASADQPVFTRSDLLALHDQICQDAKALMLLKNQDYSGATADPFGNFRASEFIGVDPVMGIVLRCMDKFARLKSFVACGSLVVKDEPVTDIFRDVVNYMVLAAGMVEEARRQQKRTGA